MKQYMKLTLVVLSLLLSQKRAFAAGDFGIDIFGDEWTVGYRDIVTDAQKYYQIVNSNFKTTPAKNHIVKLTTSGAVKGMTSDNLKQKVESTDMAGSSSKGFLIEIGGNDFLAFVNRNNTKDKTDEQIKNDVKTITDNLKKNLQFAINNLTGKSKYVFLAQLTVPSDLKNKMSAKGYQSAANDFEAVYTNLCSTNKTNKYFYCLSSFTKDLLPADFKDSFFPNIEGNKKLATNVTTDLRAFFNAKN